MRSFLLVFVTSEAPIGEAHAVRACGCEVPVACDDGEAATGRPAITGYCFDKLLSDASAFGMSKSGR